MKTKLIAMLALINFEAFTQTIGMLDQQNGFQQYKIGKTFDIYKTDLALKETKDNISSYRHKNASLIEFHSLRPSWADFDFYEGVLYDISIVFKAAGATEYDRVVNELKSAYGKPTESKETMTGNIWNAWSGKKTNLYAQYFTRDGGIFIEFQSVPIESRVKAARAEVYFKAGNSKILDQDYEGAISDYGMAIEILPTYTDAYNNRGLAKSELKQDMEALDDYNKAIETRPDAGFFLNRGSSKYKLEDFRGAISDCNKAIEINPGFSKALNQRGQAKRKLSDYAGAINDFNRAIQLSPKEAGLYFNRGLAKLALLQKDAGCLDLSKAGELGYKEAYEIIRKFCNQESSSQSIKAYFDEGNKKLESKDYLGAIDLYNKIIDTFPYEADLSRVYYNRGLAKGKLREFSGAIADCDKAIDIKPNYGNAFFIRGMSKFELGQKESGCLDFKKAAELGCDAYDANSVIRKFCN